MPSLHAARTLPSLHISSINECNAPEMGKLDISNLSHWARYPPVLQMNDFFPDLLQTVVVNYVLAVLNSNAEVLVLNSHVVAGFED